MKFIAVGCSSYIAYPAIILLGNRHELFILVKEIVQTAIHVHSQFERFFYYCFCFFG